MKNEFSTFDITKALGIPRERLKDWMNNGFIQPTEPAHGKGTKAVFTLLDVYGIALFQDLIQKGFKRELASRFVKRFVRYGIEAFGYIKFINGEIEILSPDDYALILSTGRIGDYDPESHKIKPREISPGGEWDYIHLVNLKKLRQKVDIALSKLG